MDLATCKKKLASHQYKSAEECCDEIQLIWDNCKKYNAEGSVIIIILFLNQYKNLNNILYIYSGSIN